MTTPEADEQATVVSAETPGPQPPPSAVSSPPPQELSAESLPSLGYEDALPTAETVALPVVSPAPAPAPPAEPQVTYVPMSVTIGDGFKFGCGFFLAGVVALLVGFVLLAALFVLTGLFGLSLPIGR